MTYKQEYITPYDNGQEKSEQVEHMFDNIAHSYDLLNRRLSFGIDSYWRKTALKQLEPFSPQKILDIATGTGDLAILSTKMLHPQHVTGIDISEGMMDIGREKVRKNGLDNIISFEKQDCEKLTYQDNSFDAIISAFGIRNFQHLDKGLAEMCRVLKNGGHACIIELSHPMKFPMKQLFKIYSHTILPIYGKFVSKDNNAYRYLTSTIEAFPQGEEMTKSLKKAGFCQTRFKRLTFGICTCYIATK